ncbi:NAD-P-binding protein [Lactarius indigo]|nr:NAD-P-binding protein [Lactarius indigo]
MDPIQSVVGWGKELPVANHHDVSTIDPKETFANQKYRGKVVLITGASRGVGQETAITYAMAGANVTIAGRSQDILDKIAAAIHAAVSGAQVLAVSVDVRDPKATEVAVQATLERFGRLDVLVPNAGALSNFNPNLGDTNRWWNTFEVNVRGVYDTVRASLSAPEMTSGRVVGISSSGVQLRAPYASNYTASKHPTKRLVEFIALGALTCLTVITCLRVYQEYPKVTVFALHVGAIRTQMAEEASVGFPDNLHFSRDYALLNSSRRLVERKIFGGYLGYCRN